MRAKYLVMLDALGHGHSFTSSDGITLMGAKDEDGQLYVAMRQGEGEDEEIWELQLNQFLRLCDEIPDEDIANIEKKLSES